MKLELTINCCLCEKDHKTEVDLPPGWEHRYGGIDDEGKGFCPDHAPIAAFAEAQCPGCVGGWGDCNMWSAFAYSGRSRTINAGDYKALERGVCLRRTNGTLSMSRGRIEDLDLSNRAPPESGAAFAKAIREYCDRYPSDATGS